jgi:hypothetical protein
MLTEPLTEKPFWGVTRWPARRANYPTANLWAVYLESVESLTSHNPRGVHGLSRGYEECRLLGCYVVRFLKELMFRYVPQKRRFLQGPHGVTYHKTALFIVTAVKTSNLTCDGDRLTIHMCVRVCVRVQLMSLKFRDCNGIFQAEVFQKVLFNRLILEPYGQWVCVCICIYVYIVTKLISSCEH